VKVLLLSAYAAKSHEHWRRMLQTMFAHWEWQVLTLPPRHFSWRVRGNALYWSQVEKNALQAQYDLVVATSMVDLATLRGLVPALAQRPTLLYFHENQFAYPQDRQRHTLVEAQITSLYSGLAADRILFNSSYNCETFLLGCDALLAKLPDMVPPGLVASLREKSAVVPVPLAITASDPTHAHWPAAHNKLGPNPVRLVWLGRFEHDKGGENLLRILTLLEAAGLDYELALVGQQFREEPAVFGEIKARCGHRLAHCGYIESVAAYRGLLASADIVLSTAAHEFQGLAIMEAVQLNCVPLVPNRLVYPEIYPRLFCYQSSPDSPGAEAQSAVDGILAIAANWQHYRDSVPDLTPFSQRNLIPVYEREFQSILRGQDSQ
jgi:glycosyltransferase involved in cell wall biosynthesis